MFVLTRTLCHCNNISANLTCNNFVCPDGQRCLINPSNKQPVCTSCETQCIDTISHPVVGTDGHWYNSYCQMIKFSCDSDVFVSTKRSGRRKNKDFKLGKPKQVKLRVGDNDSN